MSLESNPSSEILRYIRLDDICVRDTARAPVADVADTKPAAHLRRTAD